MKDTHPKIEERFFKMTMERSGEERLKMGFEMDETARRLVVASVLNEDLKASAANIRIAIFERFYGNDLSSGIKKEFIERIKDISGGGG